MGVIYLDSCIVIDITSVSDARGEAMRERVESVGNNDELVTSPLVDLECMIRPLRIANQNAIAAMRSVLARFRHLEISARAFDLGGHIRAIHGLEIPDALHYATASLAECDEFWTTDKSLLRIAPDFAMNPLILP